MRQTILSTSCLIPILFSTNCATLRDSTLLGVGVGATVGAGFGAAAGHSEHMSMEGAAVGLAIGAAIGGLAGYLQHKKSEEQKYRALMEPRPEAPGLTAPQVQRVWVPARVDNDTFVDGHYQFVISQPSRWRNDEGTDPATTNKSTKFGKGSSK